LFFSRIQWHSKSIACDTNSFFILPLFLPPAFLCIIPRCTVGHTQRTRVQLRANSKRKCFIMREKVSCAVLAIKLKTDSGCHQDVSLSLSLSLARSRALSPTHTTHTYNTHTHTLPPPLTHSTRQSAPQLRTYSRTICCPYLEIHQVICPGLHILHLAVQIITGTNSNSRPTRVRMVQVCRAPGERERERQRERERERSLLTIK
jgi:hypothetical protein